MKSAACWFAGHLQVTTSEIGDDKRRVVELDFDKIINERIEQVSVEEYDAL